MNRITAAEWKETGNAAVTAALSGERTMIETIEDLRRHVDLTDTDAAVIERVGRVYPWRVTEYYASLIDGGERSCPLRMQAIPAEAELDTTFGDPDPLDENAHAPVPGVIRVYPDRVAVIVTERCPMYCRHCLRKRYKRGGADDLTGDRLRDVVRYIRRDSSIRDVLLTGGDPLMLDDGELDGILGELRAIDHVEILRIGTRALCTWPERVTESFAAMIRRHHPVWVSTQFNHPREITCESRRAVETLIDSGIPVNNQSVLLRGVNDSAPVMKELVRKLVQMRIRPYYIYQAQTLSGTGHFVTTIETGLGIIEGLRGWTTGFAVPQYVLDTPHGKVPLNPDYLIGRTGDYVEMIGFDGKRWREYNPVKRVKHLCPVD